MRELAVRGFVAFGLAAGALGILSTAVVADDSAMAATESYAAEVTASRLHLRAGPGSSYQSVELTEQGDKVIVRDTIEGGWAVVEVPGGCKAWVSARFVEKGANGTGTVTVQNLLLRPRPSTQYHQLASKLDKGESLSILDEKRVGDDVWLQVRAPQRVPLYCAAQYLKKIGPASLAMPKAEAKPEATVAGATPRAPAANAGADMAGSHDDRFIVVERRALEALSGARSIEDLRPIERTLASVDETRLSLENRKRHVLLERKLLDRERELIVASVQDKEQAHLQRLEEKIKAIESKYQARLTQIEEERTAKKTAESRYTAVGIIEYKPHLLGQTPAFRITNGGKLRYYLIAPAFDLHKFAGKRVGVIGLLDRESGTGYFTLMAKRLEIIADK